MCEPGAVPSLFLGGGFRWVHFYIIMEGLREKEFIRKPILLALKREKAQNFWTLSLY
jgi:hypothetical protein